MQWIQSVVYGLLSGFTEFLPVSSNAHQILFRELFGMEFCPLLDLFVHLASLFALLIGNRTVLVRIQREKLRYRRMRRSRNPRSAASALYDSRLVMTATIPMMIVLLLQYVTISTVKTPLMVLFLIVNGIIMLVPEHMRHANKNAQSMSGLDGIFMGLFGGLSALPGISRNGAVAAFAVARGADRQCAVDWALLLSIPALIVLVVLDLTAIISTGVGEISFVIVLSYIMAALAAALGGYLSIRLIRFMAVHLDFSGFAYYSLGVALFSFVLYLIT